MNTTYANGDKVAISVMDRDSNKKYYIHTAYECKILSSNDIGYYVEVIGANGSSDEGKRIFIDKDTPTILINHVPPKVVNIVEKPVKKHWWSAPIRY